MAASDRRSASSRFIASSRGALVGSRWDIANARLTALCALLGSRYPTACAMSA